MDYRQRIAALSRAPNYLQRVAALREAKARGELTEPQFFEELARLNDSIAGPRSALPKRSAAAMAARKRARRMPQDAERSKLLGEFLEQLVRDDIRRRRDDRRAANAQVMADLEHQRLPLMLDADRAAARDAVRARRAHLRRRNHVLQADIGRAVENMFEPDGAVAIELGERRHYVDNLNRPRRVDTELHGDEPVWHPSEHTVLSAVTRVVREELPRLGGSVKILLAFRLVFVKPATERDPDAEAPLVRWVYDTNLGSALPILNQNVAREVCNQALVRLNAVVEDQINNLPGSGYVLQSTGPLVVQAYRHNPRVGRRAHDVPPPPAWVKGLWHVENDDERCFMWAVDIARHPNLSAKNPGRITRERRRMVEQRLDCSMLTFPVSPSDMRGLRAFEQANELRLAIYEPASSSWKKFVQIFTPGPGSAPVIVLVLHGAKERYHYDVVSNPSALFPKNNHKSARFACHRCGCWFPSEDVLRAHSDNPNGCSLYEPTVLELPRKNLHTLKFTAWRKTMRLPFIIYYDFEANDVTIGGQHKPASVKAFLKSDYPELVPSERRMWFGDDCADSLLEWLAEIQDALKEALCTDIDMSPEELARADAALAIATHCGICGGAFPKKRSECEACRKQVLQDVITAHIEDLTQEGLRGDLLKARLKADMPLLKNRADVIVNAEYCSCNGPVDEQNYMVRDHDHLDGKFRCIAHRRCNLDWALSKQTKKDGPRKPLVKIPVLAHNARNYDQRFLIPRLPRVFPNATPSVLSTTYEKFTSIDLGVYSFRDSCNHIGNSLEKIVASMRDGADKLVAGPASAHLFDVDIPAEFADVINQRYDLLCKTFPHLAGRMRELYPNLDHRLVMEHVSRKGIYPYTWATDFHVYDQTELPPIESFKSDLHGNYTEKDLEELTEDYQFAQRVWRFFEMDSMRNYHDLYLETDVELLADYFEGHRADIHDSYGLDAAHYVSLASITIDAALKTAGPDFEYECFHNGLEQTGPRGIKDTAPCEDQTEMHLMVESARRGGICQVSHRYARSNIKGRPDFDPAEPESSLFYGDYNSLYPSSMIFPMPQGDWRWEKDISLDQVLAWPQWDTLERGLFVEIDVHIPDHLHDELADYPPFATRRAGEYSTYMRGKLREQGLPEANDTEKLVLDLEDKKNYVCHIAYLQAALKLGVVVTKLHRVLSFKQTRWMAGYINKNIAMRRDAKTKVRKDSKKLMSNGFYGRLGMQVRKHKDIRLVWKNDKLQKWIDDPRFSHEMQYDTPDGQHLWAIRMKRATQLHKQALGAAVAVLDVSKSLMLNLHYQVLRPAFTGDHGPPKLCYTDTDSFMYHITMPAGQLQERMISIRDDHLDTAEYPAGHPVRSTANAGKLNFFKDELCGKPILGLIALSPKTYCLQLETKIKVAGKGITKASQRELQWLHYVDALEKVCRKKTKAVRITATKHQIRTIEQEKWGLSAFDNKRWVLDDGITTLPHGHYSLRV